MNSGGYIPDSKRLGIFLALWTDPEGGSCFSIYQISWINIKKELFVNKRRHLEFVYVSIWQCFGDHFLSFCCKFNKKMFSHRPVNTDKPNFVSFLVFVGAAASFTAVFRNYRETRSRFESRPKTVNIQGYSELREPIRTRKNCYPLIWWILINNYSLKSRWIVAKYLPSRESGEVNIPKATIHRDWKE